MPRSHRRPRTTTLYLPPPGSVDSGSGSGNKSQSQPQPAAPSQPPTLEVLLMAQQIAHSRGHAFDIESFLLPSQRDEYLAHLTALADEDDAEAARVASASGASGSRSEGDEADPSTSTSQPSSTSAPSSSSRPTLPPLTLPDDDALSLLTADLDPSQDSAAGAAAAPDAADADDAERTPKRPRLNTTATPLAQQYWRQRLVSLARARSSTPRVKTEDGMSPAPSPAVHTPHPHTPHTRAKDSPAPLMENEKSDIESSASYWNHLLIQARAARGPQFDYNTQQMHFDRASDAHYTQGRPPPDIPERDVKEDKDKDAGVSASANPSTNAVNPKERPGTADRPTTADRRPNGTPNGDAASAASSTPAPPGASPVPPSPRQPSPRRQPSQNQLNQGQNQAQGGHSQRPPTPNRPNSNHGPNQNPNQNRHMSPPNRPPSQQGQGQYPPQMLSHDQQRQAQAQAQAQVQAQALALGSAEGMGGGGLNPALLMQPPQGINPLSLMGMQGQGGGPMIGGQMWDGPGFSG